jgi:hypothetical protein
MEQNSNRVLIIIAMTLSIIGCTLFLLLPAGSLIVNLVYQAF